MVNTPAFQAGNAGSISGTPLHNRITSFWFSHRKVPSHRRGRGLAAPGSKRLHTSVISSGQRFFFFGVLASIHFKQFDELSAAENVLLVFPNELRKAYALFVIKRNPLVINGFVTIIL